MKQQEAAKSEQRKRASDKRRFIEQELVGDTKPKHRTPEANGLSPRGSRGRAGSDAALAAESAAMKEREAAKAEDRRKTTEKHRKAEQALLSDSNRKHAELPEADSFRCAQGAIPC